MSVKKTVKPIYCGEQLIVHKENNGLMVKILDEVKMYEIKNLTKWVNIYLTLKEIYHKR